MADKPLRKLRFTVTQSAANAYTEATIDAPIDLLGNIVMGIRGVEVYFDSQPDTMASGDQYTIQVLKNGGKSASPSINSTDVIKTIGFEFNMVTSGAIVYPRTIEWWCPEGVFIPYSNDDIIVAFDTSGQGSAKTVSGIIYYTPEKVSQQEFFAFRD